VAVICTTAEGTEQIRACVSRYDQSAFNRQSSMPEQGWMTEHFLLPFENVSNGAHMPSLNSIISIFVINQDRLETNLLQLFGHTKFRMVFSNFWYYF